VPDEHPANSPPADAPPAAQAPAAAPAAASPPQTTILPDRLLATGNVRLASPRLDAECARLEAWFINRPSASDDGPAAPPRGRFEPLREPVQPASFAQSGAPEGAIRNVIRPPNLQKFRVGGELIQMQLVVAGRQFDLEDLMIDKRATIDETRTPQEGQQPIHIAGDLIELHHGTSPEAKVEIIGRQAEAGGRGLTLAGRKILIDGPGEATLPAPDGQSLAIIPRSDRGPGAAAAPPLHRPAPLPPQKLHLDWQEGLTFDGQTVHIRGDVHARTSTQLAMAKTLDAQLSQRVDFAGSISGQQPELARLHLGGGVFIENRGEDERGQQTSLDQGNFPNLTIDRAAGKLRVAGQGWVNTVRRAGELLPAQPQPGAPPRGPIQPPRGDDAPLTSIHIDFERGIEGDLARREIEFQQQVRTTYAPAREFTDQIVVRRLADLGPRGVLMTSQRLMIRELALPGRPPFLEADATGNVVIDHVQFTANGAHVRYSGDKETLVISGDGFADSLISYESEPGLPRSTSQARKYTYWIREGVFQGEGFKSINLLPGGLLRLPR
jgi:hypothetical protein